MRQYNVDNHTIEFCQGSSTLNPWSSNYCSEIGLSMVCTSDVTSYMRIDGEQIYHLRSFGKQQDLIEALEEGSIETWNELLYIFDGMFDEFAKLSPEEKKKRLIQWRI